MSAPSFQPVYTSDPSVVTRKDGQFIVSQDNILVDVDGRRVDVLGDIKEAIGVAHSLAELLEEAQGVRL
jgi:flagellar basal body rod protein FlgG